MTIEGSYGCFILSPGKVGRYDRIVRRRVALLFAHTTPRCVHNISTPRSGVRGTGCIIQRQSKLSYVHYDCITVKRSRYARDSWAKNSHVNHSAGRPAVPNVNLIKFYGTVNG